MPIEDILSKTINPIKQIVCDNYPRTISLSGIVKGPKMNPNSNTTYFTLVHNFGGNNKPLFLRCKAGNTADKLHNGDRININAYLRPTKYGIMAFIKSLKLN